MKYNKQGYRKKCYKKRPKKKEMQGLCVEVWNNNIEAALKIFKKKVKESKLLYDLKEKQYYKKPSAIKSEKRKLGKVRNWIKQHQINPDWCGEPPTAGLKEKIKKERLKYKK